MRLDLYVPVVGVTLLAAAAAQDLVPVTPDVPVKLVFLTAAGLYHAMTKPLAVGLTALVWAGALTDALGACRCSARRVFSCWRIVRFG